MIGLLAVALLWGAPPSERQALAARLATMQDSRVVGLGDCASTGTALRVCGKGELKKCPSCALTLRCPLAKPDPRHGPFAPPPGAATFSLQLELGPDRIEQPTEKLPASQRQYSATLRLLPSNVTLDLADTVITYFRPSSYFGAADKNYVPVAVIGPAVLDSLCTAALKGRTDATERPKTP